MPSADRDAELSRRIAALASLRDAELLLYEAGRWFRSGHAAELLARLPDLDLRDDNAGARVRQLVRFLAAGTLSSPDPVSGPALAACVAALARLRYAPPEAVPQLCAALLAGHGRKLRRCGGGDLAGLAWGLAALELLYGDLHQAVKLPAGTARARVAAGGGARVVGHVAAGGSGGAEAGAQEAAEEAGVGRLGAGEGATARADVGLEPSAGPAAARALSGAGDAVQPELQQEPVSAAGADTNGGERELEAGAAAATAGSTAVPGTARPQAPDGAAQEHQAAEVAADPAPRPSLSLSLSEETPDGFQSTAADALRTATAAPGSAAPAPAVPRWRRRRHGLQLQSRAPPEQVWLVPAAMAAIWQRLAAAAGAAAAAGDMEGEHLAKVAWAYAKVGRADPRLFGQLAGATLELLMPYLERVEAAAAAAPSYASVAAAASVATGGPPPLDAASVTNLVWAFVTAGQQQRQLLAALATVVVPYKSSYDNDQLATIARSYAAAVHYDTQLCTAIGMVTSRRLRHLTASQLPALLGSLAALGHREGELALAGGPVGRALSGLAEQLSPHEACELLWSVAQLRLDVRVDESTPGAGVLGLGLTDPADAERGTAAATSASGTVGNRGSGRSAGGGGGRGRRSGATEGALAVLIGGMLGRCDQLAPAELVRAVTALALLPPGGGGGGGRELRRRLAAELREALGRQPPGAFGGAAALRQLYGASQLVGQMLEAEGADSGFESAGSVSWDHERWEEEVAAIARASGDEEGGEAGAHSPSPWGSPGRGGGGSQRQFRSGGGREPLFASASAWAGARSFATSAEEPPTAPHCGAAAAERGWSQPELQEEQETTAPTGPTGSPQPEQAYPPQRRRSSRRRRGTDELGAYDEADPYDSSWSDVDWDSISVPPPAAAASAAGLRGAAPPRAALSGGSGGCGGEGSGLEAGTATATESAVALASGPLPYTLRKVYDEASGRELWEVAAPDAGGAGARSAEEPAARLLPPGLLAACRAAAREEAAAEVARLEAAEGEPGELWKLEVALALHDLTGSEPLARWSAAGGAAVADLLLPPPPAADEAGAGAGAGWPTHGSPPLPVAVLLLGPHDTTSNPPYIPLGHTRLRQRLLEALGVRVLLLPRFLWRAMGSSPEEQLCLLGNLLGRQR
ncbi:hypothetical protein GPECTOR_10g941 [Gonium pectorale]|uniref:RAP domain-containing protein n=1 Tax=Gonium pectorale TaxID=33097 RepID=A0A150GR43_GONPE|nr:hypothetical protein GPECTOR_10g941 [Gonium pectorale]|eukprot:KXZ52309.1 hypothetical protein GPECTOR_10g941 [Gonium pectorale]